MNYQELKVRANNKGIYTFGDMLTACDADPRDVWGESNWEPEITTEYLYNCDAVTGLLEQMALEGEI